MNVEVNENGIFFDGRFVEVRFLESKDKMDFSLYKVSEEAPSPEENLVIYKPAGYRHWRFAFSGIWEKGVMRDMFARLVMASALKKGVSRLKPSERPPSWLKEGLESGKWAMSPLEF